jgi:hypothetical protein
LYLYIEHGKRHGSVPAGYKSDGMKDKTFNEAASRLLKKPQVAARIAAIRDTQRRQWWNGSYTRKRWRWRIGSRHAAGVRGWQCRSSGDSYPLKVRTERLIVRQEEIGNPGEFDSLSTTRCVLA